eukprot:335357-Prymnesium_polylepis.1
MARTRDVVAFVTSQYLSKEHDDPAAAAQKQRACSAFNCALLQWAVQAQAVATRIQELASGQAASVHLFSPCFSPALATVLSRCRADGTRCPARLIVHERHAPAL